MSPLESNPLDIASRRADLADLHRLLSERRLLPVLPLIYVAWSDGELSAAELSAVKEIARRQKWLEQDCFDVLESWLDPDDPPTALELGYLLKAIRRASQELGESERMTLAELGAEMADLYESDGDGAGEVFQVEEIRQALRDLEDALGLVGREATRSIFEDPHLPPAQEPPPAHTFDVLAMKAILDGNHHALRDEVRTMLAGEDFSYVYDLPLKDYRDQVMVWLNHLAEHNIGERCLPRPKDGYRDMSEFLAIFETLGIFDLSLLVKFGVQFGLFGGSILFLGTEEHHEKYLADVASLKLQGCYAMTEMGRGSNVRDIETIARYDVAAEEFVIHTPTETARKEWIGGAGTYATMATVYAQLIIDDPGFGDPEEYGVHAFLVPIRDEEGHPLEGVRIEDQGLKMGLNGVDNGRIWFDHVRIPRKNLLNRYGNVTAEGHYESSIPSSNRRFFTMLGTLVAGRLGISAAGLSAARSALTIAIRYGAHRRQFGPAGEPEVPILNYRMHQRELIPKLATAYAVTFGLHRLMERYNDPAEPDQRQVEALAAGLKAYSSWFAIDAVQSSRECCGGQGYLTLNRLPEIRKDVDVFATFEGANMVMMQQVAKGSLSEFRREMANGSFFSMARMIANQAARNLSETNPVVIRNTDEDHLRSADYQLSALSYRESDLRVGLARRLKRRIDEGMDSFLAFNDCQDHAVALANAHIEHFLLRAFVDAEQACEEERLRKVLSQVRALFALSCMERDLAWFLENNYVQTAKARAIRDQVNLLCAEVRIDALSLVEAFGIPDEVLSAPIAFSDSKSPADAQIQHARGVKQ